MVSRYWLIIYPIIFILSIPSSGFSKTKSLPDFAVISQMQGKITVGYAKQMAEGYNGIFLSQRQRVKTEKDGKTTVFIKDGSEIRLFTDSELILGAKKSHNSRWMRYRLVLLSGSFWGHFVRNTKPIEINGGALRLQISEASIRFSKKNHSRTTFLEKSKKIEDKFVFFK